MSNFKIDEKGFWYCENEEGHCFDSSLCSEIEKIFEEKEINDVVDFGCGPGKYVKRFIESGRQCIGYDGNPHTPKYTNGTCQVLDLSEVFNLNKKFDCVVSLEVGEHIPKEYEQIFIDNIASHTNRFLICSWAVPGQGGDGHVNCQTNEYIIEEISKRGFEINSNLTKRIRNASSLSWFKNTLFFFESSK